MWRRRLIRTMAEISLHALLAESRTAADSIAEDFVQ